MVNRLKYSQLKLGDKVSFKRTINNHDLNNFVELSGDNNPLHIDAEYGAKSKFGNNIVHGMLLASFFSKIVGIYFGKNILYLNQTLEFRKPAFVGDKIIVEGIIELISEATKIIQLKTLIKRGNEIIVKGNARIKYI